FRCKQRPKALPLETTSFLKKAGQKLLVSLLCFIKSFLPTRPLGYFCRGDQWSPVIVYWNFIKRQPDRIMR
ncbi:MAG: hypothetical protein ACI4JM_05020, partial [Oscillospiraceae bacterium]